MLEKDYDVMGVEDGGIVIGYVTKSEFNEEGVCRDFYRTFTPYEMVSESTPLIQTLYLLNETERVFVLEGNRVNKVVTLADLQKQPVRMLMFGIISLFEMQVNRIIKEYLPDDLWQDHLQLERVEKAKELFTERKSRNEAIELCDCLQICDKRDVIMNDENLRNLLGIKSKTKGKVFFKDLEKLRNNLAHSQDLNTTNSWNDILKLIKQTEEYLARCEQI